MNCRKPKTRRQFLKQAGALFLLKRPFELPHDVFTYTNSSPRFI